MLLAISSARAVGSRLYEIEQRLYLEYQNARGRAPSLPHANAYEKKKPKRRGRRAAVPKFKKPVARRLVCGDFCLSCPASSGARFGRSHIGPLKRSEPPTG